MGLGDNRRSPKMRRKVAQRKLKARIKRQAAVRGEGRKSTQKAPAKTKKAK